MIDATIAVTSAASMLALDRDVYRRIVPEPGIFGEAALHGANVGVPEVGANVVDLLAAIGVEQLVRGEESL